MISADTHRGPFSASRSACIIGMALCSLALFGLAGCNTFSEVASAPAADQVAPTATLQNAGDVKYYPSDEPLKLGLEYFKQGSYGIANRYFRDAVEKAPKDAEAWIGLAATYDRLRRFDLADQAYAQAIKLTGETIQILNDRGYSYMLRGDLGKARAKFLKAYELDPTNPTVVNNVQLLNSSYRFIEGSVISAALAHPRCRFSIASRTFALTTLPGAETARRQAQSSNGRPAYCSASDAWACSEACRYSN